MSERRPAPGASRRSYLAATASAATASLSGCLSRIRTGFTHSGPEQISLTIKALPADEDPASVQIARTLASHCGAVGIDAELEVLTGRLLLRDILFNHEFDLFVVRHPGHDDPDELRPLLHSQFSEEPGWQNAFGLSNRLIDELLEEQYRQSDVRRRETVGVLQYELLEEQPFAPIASPRHVTAGRGDLEFPEEGMGLADPLLYLRLDDVPDTLQVALLDSDATRNRNPLAVEFRTQDRLADLLYDPLARRIGGQYVPWLAEQWTIDADADVATVGLRSDLTWHDGTELTAGDVVFTYRFLSDTSLGEAESPIPAPRFRGRTSPVDGVERLDDRTLEISFAGCSEAVCRRSLTVPVLPADHWSDRTDLIQDYLTEAVLDEIDEPIGSGPVRFVDVVEEESITLERYDDHFLRDDVDRSLPPGFDPYVGGPQFERLEASVAANARSAIEALSEGDVDLVGSPLPVDTIGAATGAPGVRLLEADTPAYYMLGFNARRHPLTNHQFRAALVRLLDRGWIADEVFDDRAMPVETPLHSSGFVPHELEWSGTSVAGEFPGSDGDLDVEAARELFREAGFRYDDGALLGRQ